MAVKPKDQQKRLRWYAVLCRNTREVEKVEKGIKKLGIPFLVPRAFRMEKRGKWMVAVDDGLLFPPFLFVAMRTPGSWKSKESLLWGALYDVRGLVRVMGNRDAEGNYRPQALPYEEMRKIRSKHQAGERKMEEQRFTEGQAVKITNGPFAGFDGIFEKPVKERVRILISIFGSERGVELEETDVRAA